MTDSTYHAGMRELPAALRSAHGVAAGRYRPVSVTVGAEGSNGSLRGLPNREFTMRAMIVSALGLFAVAAAFARPPATSAAT